MGLACQTERSFYQRMEKKNKKFAKFNQTIKERFLVEKSKKSVNFSAPRSRPENGFTNFSVLSQKNKSLNFSKRLKSSKKAQSYSRKHKRTIKKARTQEYSIIPIKTSRTRDMVFLNEIDNYILKLDSPTKSSGFNKIRSSSVSSINPSSTISKRFRMDPKTPSNMINHQDMFVLDQYPQPSEFSECLKSPTKSKTKKHCQSFKQALKTPESNLYGKIICSKSTKKKQGNDLERENKQLKQKVSLLTKKLRESWICNEFWKKKFYSLENKKIGKFEDQREDGGYGKLRKPSNMNILSTGISDNTEKV